MDRYDRIIRDIQRKTDDETIRWRMTNPAGFSKVLINAWRVIRAFTAEYYISGRSYNLLFVERKVDVHDEFGDSSERYGYELIVLDEDSQIVLSLYEGIVDRDDLLKLSGLIDGYNDRVNSFFAAFDKSGPPDP